ncbi:uncharacterized protein LOC134538782 [Bacillus rossius redtenbacheri]|uniref:uncharacterized protein LOC134538782 n=1 Tax=Bacillus rossius redtenbacheri TaxID=93214 RepID=UPI002FDED275
MKRVEGKLVAKSMVFKTPEPTVLLQFESPRYGDLFLEVESDWMPGLSVGECYSVTNLRCHLRRMKGRGELVSVLVLRPSEHTSCVQITALPLCCGPSIFTCYQGTVTDVFAPLCMYQLDGRVWLCLAYVWVHVHLCVPRVGARVEVWNAHCVEDCLVLCERGHFTVIDGGDASSAEDGIIRPLHWLLETLQLGFADALWMRAQYCALQEKFRQLLSTLPPEDEAIAVDLILANLVEHMARDMTYHTLTLKAVFLNHDEQCCVTREGVLAGDLLTVRELAAGMTAPQVSQHWRHKKTQHGLSPREAPLVCYLTAGCGHLLASDDTGSLPAIIAGPTAVRLPSLLGVIVIIPVCQLVFEWFKEVKVLKYLQVSQDDVKGALDLNESLPVVGALCPHCHHIRASHHDCPSRLSLKLHLELQHKTAPIAENRQNAPYCHLLGRLVDYTKVQVERGGLVCLTLEKDLVPLQQALSVGATYEVCLPPSAKLSRRKMFPNYHTWNGRTLPVQAAFILPHDVSLKPLCFTDPPCLRVLDCLRDVPDLCCFEGVLVTRRHNDPSFPSERLSIGLDGFGIPGPRVMVLTLRDEGGCLNDEVSIFLNNWKMQRYPLGMLSGATVVCWHALSKVSEGGKPYFVNNKFTCLSVKKLRA